MLAVAAATGCAQDDPLPQASADPGTRPLDPADLCRTPNQGCPCGDSGAFVDCGKVVEQHDDYVTCSVGHRSCDSGTWGACLGERQTQARAAGQPPAGSSYRIQALGTSAECPAGFDPCDPFCNQFVDAPGDFAAGPGFVNGTAGLTLSESVAVGCDSLSITATDTTVHVNQFSPLTLQEGTVGLTAELSPAGCRPSPFLTTWTIDKFDVAQVTGTNDQNGEFTVTSPVAGDVVVTAYAAGLSGSLTLHVKVNVLEAPTTSGAANPNTPALGGQITAFGTVSAPAAGSGASTAAWLYPYANTYFPLGLLPPALMYSYSVAGGGAVKVSLRYPANASAADADFNYSLIVKETNGISQSAAIAANTLDPQVVVPTVAWQAFEQTARGADADLLVQRLPASGTLEQATRRPIHFVNGQLKGTVYYNSYSSPQGGNTGAVLSIAPGASSPELAVQPSGKCTVCHSLNVSGTALIANGARTSNGIAFNQSRRYDLTNGAASSPDVLNSYDSPSGDTENVPGDRFTFGAPLTDGAFYMTHGGVAPGDPNFRAPPDFSNLYSVGAPSTIVPVTGWPTNALAVTPRFAVDGTRLAFGFWGGDALGQSPSGTLASATTGTRLAVVDFTCATPPCGAGSSGFEVKNARDLTPSVGEKTAWPSFTPSGNSVLYQRQYRSAGAVVGWSPSDINTSTGALAEIWASNVPANSSTAATPTRLSQLNGLNGAGASYLPSRPRTLVDNANPLYRFPTVRHEMSQTGAVGVPAVYLTGTAASSQTGAGGPWDFKIMITTAGPRGTARFKYSTNGGVSWQPPTGRLTGAAVALNYGDGTGLTANFGSGANYSASSIYSTLINHVSLAGTPQGGPWDFRINIVTTGARGTATFRYSTNGGLSWSGPLTTGASVPLGATGMVAIFSNTVTYDSTAWTWAAQVANYHDPNASFTINIADNCRASNTATTVNDYRLNYLPSVNPTEAGDMAWVVFTSRRMYGNVAYDDPWDAEPAHTDGVPFSCYSGTPPTKKLWVSAIDPDAAPGTDPSHPAFYLPGQELKAGNSHAYWVSTPCAATGASCSTSDDCCGGSGTPLTARCNGSSKVCQSVDDCEPASGACATSADCCTGLVCSGAGLCEDPVFFSTETFAREYVAECQDGYKVAWRSFEWQATIPAGTSIDISVQTKNEDDADYLPATGVLLDSITDSTPAATWVHGTETVDEVLSDAEVGSLAYLKVSMTFNPNPDGNSTPTLNAWRQNYDCLPAE
ncbi:MAG TPA: hypothetical protein VHP33_32965 [Polyangiaceae bacterium]|nr:hypothetical protein [Polyangiaceae bacterium]